jgi:hypothetical protein
MLHGENTQEDFQEEKAIHKKLDRFPMTILEICVADKEVG